jgi:formylglycine-generating enzyme required for sulfatase activity
VAAGNGDEAPLHRVKFARPFAVGVDEVTRGQFARFAAETGFRAGGGCQVVRHDEWQVVDELTWKSPGFAQSDADPVVCVSWREATQYAEWLARKSGKPYRLPSEAEWEYLARRGGEGRALTHDTANYGEEKCCARKVEGRDAWEFTAPVGSFPADAFGLHDVLGNVWEWLADCYHENYVGAPADGRAWAGSCSGKRIVRGGSYGDGSMLLRPAYRLRGPEDARYATLGLRVARDLD